MARETKAEADARRAIEEREEREAQELFRVSLPTRMLTLQALAREVGNISTEVVLLPSGPELQLREQNDGFVEVTINYDSEEWQVEYVERILEEKRQEIIAKKLRRTKAQSIIDNLTTEERIALKEHSYLI